MGGRRRASSASELAARRRPVKREAVDMRRHHPDFEYARPFLIRDWPHKPADEARQFGIDAGLAPESRPDYVVIEAVTHGSAACSRAALVLKGVQSRVPAVPSPT